MKTSKSRAMLRLTIPLGIVIALLVVLASTTPTLANLIPQSTVFARWFLGVVVGGNPDDQVALADLPPRPGGLGITQGVIIGSSASNPRGGWIELQIQATPGDDVWSIVQWQDSAGNWIDVDSWRGIFDQYTNGVGFKKWWVDSKDFNTQFRWIVYKGTRDRVLFTSPAVSIKENKQLVITPGKVTP